MVINGLILKNTKLREVNIPYPESPGCGADFFRESSTTIEFVPVITLGGDSIISTLCLCDIEVKNLNSVTIAINLGAR